MIRVVIADDNPALRLGIRGCLADCADIEVVAEADDGDVALEMVRRHRPDVLVLDVRMPRVDGITVLERLERGEAPAVLMLTNSDDPAVVHAALSRGAHGYLVYPQKNVDEIAHAVRQVAAGETVLASRAATQLLSLLPGPDGTIRGPSAPVPDSAEPVRDELIRRFHLSTREVEVLDLLVRGSSNTAIAGELFVAEKTVKNHLNRIFAKLHAASRAEAMAIWRGDREPT